MHDGTMTMESATRKGFCERCDAPLYEGEADCIYCGGGDSGRDMHAVAVLSLLVLSGIGLLWLLLG
jgi:alkyl hydroperoxide reductase subunit AhpF